MTFLFVLLMLFLSCGIYKAVQVFKRFLSPTQQERASYIRISNIRRVHPVCENGLWRFIDL